MSAHSTGQFYGKINTVFKKKIKSQTSRINLNFANFCPLRNTSILHILKTELKISSSTKWNLYSGTSFHTWAIQEWSIKKQLVNNHHQHSNWTILNSPDKTSKNRKSTLLYITTSVKSAVEIKWTFTDSSNALSWQFSWYTNLCIFYTQTPAPHFHCTPTRGNQTKFNVFLVKLVSDARSLQTVAQNCSP